jgi:hypothetical protein
MILEIPDDGPKKRYIVEDVPCGKLVTTQELGEADEVIKQSITVMVTKAPSMFATTEEL